MYSPQHSRSSSPPIGSPVFRPAIYSIVKLLYLSLTQLPAVYAAPLDHLTVLSQVKANAEKPGNGEFWAYIGIAIALVLLGGAFAGLTIAYVQY